MPLSTVGNWGSCDQISCAASPRSSTRAQGNRTCRVVQQGQQGLRELAFAGHAWITQHAVHPGSYRPNLRVSEHRVLASSAALPRGSTPPDCSPNKRHGLASAYTGSALVGANDIST